MRLMWLAVRPHDLKLTVPKEEAKLPLATRLGTVVNAFGPVVNLVFGLMMKHDDFVLSDVNAGDLAFYLAGAKVLNVIPFGPR